ncbi:dol-P-Glc:Glc(2)Man(9)GlcNAc(2)-PP-Dol alpha-12-glucosyltransferase-like, partial [Trifolium medium]|nr:dol-P-Glc:Glc(2)Man(9)GlcNAc(2)-PP-Dol alpha-12-glucosyltransferase-like [Trifolium medium]
MGKLVLAATVSSWVIPITIIVNHIVPEPYMDEIFHIPQAQQYCKGPILGGPVTATSRSSPPLTSGVFAFRKNSTSERGGEDREMAVPEPPKMRPWAVTPGL